MNEVVMKVIGNYTYNTRDCLGEGVFGKVFEGYQRNTQEKVAIKKVDISSYSHDKYLETSIFYEIFLLKNLSHPNIIRFKDVLTTKNSLYIVTQFCKHGDLKEALKRKRFKQDEALEVIRQIVSGFSKLVGEHIIHRDLKPANILINDGVYKIGDFGFAKYVDNMDNHMLRSCVGSPIYMAPQILQHSQYTTKADIWSIGIISYEIIFGTPPWRARSEPQLLQNIRNISLTSIIRNESTKISPRTLDFLKRTLSYNQKDRIEWEQLFAIFKIQPCLPQNQQQISKNKQLPIISSVSFPFARSSSLGEPNLSRNSHVQQYHHTRSIPVHPNSTIIQPQHKSIPLIHRSSLVSVDHCKRLRQECIYKHFILVELQANYSILESILGQTRRFDRMLLLLAGSAKLKSTYAISVLFPKKQQNIRGTDDLLKMMEKEKQSYQMAQKQISKLLDKQGGLKPLKQQISSKLSVIQGGQGRILKAEELLLQSVSEVSRVLYHELKKKVPHLVDSFCILRMFDYLLDIIILCIPANNERPITELVITPTRIDEFDSVEYFNKVAARAQQLIVLQY